MELKNCLDCGRSFASKDGEKMCRRCTEKRIEDDFRKVRDYLYDHPGADIKEVSRDTEVEERIILRFLREDRIEVIEEDNGLLKCTSCGEPIRSGRFCQACKKAELAKELRSVGDELKKDIQKGSEKSSLKAAYYSKR